MTTPESKWNQLFEALGASGKQISLVVTGGGSGAASRCFRRAGASRNFVEAVIPYSCAAVTDYLGCPASDASASGQVAKQLACVAFGRASRLADNESDPSDAVGISLVAALPTMPRRRGQDRIHVALHTQQRGVWWSLELEKDADTRESAETIAEEMVFHALAELVDDLTNDDLTNDDFFRDAGLDLEQACFDT